MTSPNYSGKPSNRSAPPTDHFRIPGESRDDLQTCKSGFLESNVENDVTRGRKSSDQIDRPINNYFNHQYIDMQLLAGPLATSSLPYSPASSSSSSSSLPSPSSSSSSSLSLSLPKTSSKRHILQCSSCKPRLFILLLLLSAHLSQAMSNIGAVFEVQLISLRNDKGLLDDGSCCAGEVGVTGSCPGGCDVIFVICLGHYMAAVPQVPECTFGRNVTGVFNQNSLDMGVAYKLPIAFAWPGDFLLVIQAIHSSKEGSSQATPSERERGTSNKLVHKAVVQKKLNTSDEWTEGFSSRNFSSLRFRYRVVCPKDQYGPGCTITCVPRDDQLGHYRCSKDGSRICLPGWTNEYCRTPMCDCKNGDCKTPNNCKCRSGWKGEKCDECQTYPGCLHGTCNKHFQCYCDEGWTGALCNIDLNFCSKYHPCSDKGECKPNHNNYTCLCHDGFKGKNCEIDTRDCRNSNQDCLNGGTCESHNDEYKCSCRSEYEGRRCEVRKDSTCLDNPCRHNSSCQSGSFSDGRRYKCLCPAGYTGPNCDQNVNECTSQPCRNGGRCVDGINSFKCLCPPQFTGKQCEITSDCASKPCQNGGVCVKMHNGGGTKCECEPRYYGELCQHKVDHCLMNPCSNGATCEDRIHTYHCECAHGFTGKNCATKIDFCAGRPCLNGGSCSSGVQTYQCHCPQGFHGPICELYGPFSTHSAEGQHNISRDGESEVSEPGIVHFVIALVLGIFFALVAVGIIISVWWMRRQRCLHKDRIREKSDLATISIEQIENDFNKNLNNKKNFDKSSQKVAPEEVNLFLKSMDEDGKGFYDHPDFGLNFQRNQLHLNKHRPRHKPSPTNENYYQSKVPTRYKEINQDTAIVHKESRHTEV